MKKRLMWSLIACAVFSLSMLCFFPPYAMAAATVTLRVLNPLGEITPPPVSAPSARVPDLAGKRIAIYWNGKAGGDNFWNDIETLLKQRLPNANISRYDGPFDLGDDRAAKIAGEADAFFYGVGD
jgi:ABC-type amino acid transport substrate-binding protein